MTNKAALHLAAQKIAHSKHLAGAPSLKMAEERELRAACWAAGAKHVSKHVCAVCKKKFFHWCGSGGRSTENAGNLCCTACYPAGVKDEDDAAEEPA